MSRRACYPSARDLAVASGAPVELTCGERPELHTRQGGYGAAPGLSSFRGARSAKHITAPLYGILGLSSDAVNNNDAESRIFSFFWFVSVLCKRRLKDACVPGVTGVGSQGVRRDAGK